MNNELLQIYKIEDELKRLEALDLHVKKMFEEADSKKMVIGLIKQTENNDKQEGPFVKKLRDLAGK
jgi:hypothetical protein